MTPSNKKCLACKIDKAATEFYANKSRCDGLQARCKACQKEDAAIRAMWRPLTGLMHGPVTGTRVCPLCGTEKDVSEFPVDIHRPKGISDRCKPCVAAIFREHQRKLKSEDISEYRRRNRKNNLKRIYGLTLEEYGEMADACGNKCQACGDPPGIKPLFVDHCHATGKVRGLLCGKCNTSLGLLKEDPEIMRRLIAYIEEKGHSNGNSAPAADAE